MDRFRKDAPLEQELEIERTESARTEEAPRQSGVAQLQRRVGNAQLLQLRASQQRAVQQRAVQRRGAVQRDLADQVREDFALRQEQRQMAALEAQAEQISIPGGGQALPAPVQAIAEKQHGVSMDDVRVVYGADQATDPIQAKAFTTQDAGTPTVVMSSMDMHSQDAQFTLMHELSHVAQQKKGMTHGLDGLGGDPGQRESLEQHADEHAAEMVKEPSHRH